MRRLIGVCAALLLFALPVTAERGTPPTVLAPTVTADATRPPPPVAPTIRPLPSVAPIAPQTPPPPTPVSHPAPTPYAPPPRPEGPRDWLFFGDSFSDDSPYPDLLVAAEAARRVNDTPGDPHRGAIAGTGLIDTIDTYPARVAPYTLDNLVVEYGRNDFSELEAFPAAYTLALWRETWETFYADVDHAKVSRITVLGLPYIADTGQVLTTPIATERDAMDAITRDEAHRHGALYVSLDTMTADMLLTTDHIHPTPAGSRYIADQVIAAMAGEAGT
jgi:lysophospholipase L1-like esterase